MLPNPVGCVNTGNAIVNVYESVEADSITSLECTVAIGFGFGADSSVFLFFLPSLLTKEPSKSSLSLFLFSSPHAKINYWKSSLIE